MNTKKALALLVLLATSPLMALADSQARTVQYHQEDIVNIHAKVKYTTLIQLPATEKIMEATTGDKDFWIIDVDNNFCFVHPAKPDIRSNLNLITDKGNIYSFILEDVTRSGGEPDLRVIVQPMDQSSIVAANGPPRYVPATQVTALENQIHAMQAHVDQTVDQYKSAYPAQLKFDYKWKSEGPFNVSSIYHDDRFTYIKSSATEKFALYEVRDGKPNLINYDLKDGTYVISKVIDQGYMQVGKKRMNFSRKTDNGGE